MTSPRTPETEAIAAVLVEWLSRHGYPVVGTPNVRLVSVDWLYGQLLDVLDANPAPDQRAVEGRRWNAAVRHCLRILDDYVAEQRAVERRRS